MTARACERWRCDLFLPHHDCQGCPQTAACAYAYRFAGRGAKDLGIEVVEGGRLRHLDRHLSEWIVACSTTFALISNTWRSCANARSYCTSNAWSPSRKGFCPTFEPRKTRGRELKFGMERRQSRERMRRRVAKRGRASNTPDENAGIEKCDQRPFQPSRASATRAAKPLVSSVPGFPFAMNHSANLALFGD